MKKQLQGIGMVLFGALLVFFNISYEPYYVDVDIIGLIAGIIGLILMFGSEVVELLNKLNEKDKE